MRGYFLRLFGIPPWDGSERRQRVRWPSQLQVTLKSPGHTFTGVVKDLSSNGMRLQIEGPGVLKKGMKVSVIHPGPLPPGTSSVVQGKLIWLKEYSEELRMAALVLPSRDTWVEALCPAREEQARGKIRVRAEWLVPAEIEGQQEELRMRDLSVEGARLELGHPLEPGQRIVLRLYGIPVESEVRRCMPAGHRFQIGVRFLAAEEQLEKIRELVKKLSQPEPD